jgi:hypothetical protein
MLSLALGLSLVSFGVLAQQITPGPSSVLTFATSGSASVTGTATETNLAAIRIPGGSMGPNGSINVNCVWALTGTVGTKTGSIRFNATAGAVAGSPVNTAFSSAAAVFPQTLSIIRNNNSQTAQTQYNSLGTAPFGSPAAALGTTAINTAADSWVNVNATSPTAGEVITLQHCQVTVNYAP